MNLKPDDHLYYNALLYNQTTGIIPAKFSETRTVPILINPSLYHLAVIRFSIPTFNIPFFLWKTINNDKKTPDNQYYSYTMKFGLVEHTEYLVYVPWNADYQVPAIRDIQNLVQIMNTALNNLFIYMFNNAPGFPATTPPYFNYNADFQSIELMAEQNYFCDDPLTSGIKLYTNFVTKKLSDGIPTFTLQGTNSLDPKDILFVIKNNGNNLDTTNCPIGTYPNVPAFIMISEFNNSIFNIQSLKSLVITSYTLRTKEEYIQTNNTINTDSTQLIVTDFEPNRNENPRSLMQYNADIYRYIDLKSNDILRSIDLNVYWTDSYGNIYDLFINPGDYISIKLLFTLKNSIH